MNRPEREQAGAPPPFGRASDVVPALVRRLRQRLPKLYAPPALKDDPQAANAWRLQRPFDDCDTTSLSGRPWPLNGVTEDDIRRITILSNLSGIPINRLLHPAICLFFDAVRRAMNEDLAAAVPPTPDLPVALPASEQRPPCSEPAEVRPPSRVDVATPVPPRRTVAPPLADEPAGPILAAEAAPAPVPKRQRKLF